MDARRRHRLYQHRIPIHSACSDVNVLAVFAPNSGASPTRPDDVYTRIYPTAGSDRLSFSLLDMAPRYGAERAADWQFDIPVTPGENNNSPRASLT